MTYTTHYTTAAGPAVRPVQLGDKVICTASAETQKHSWRVHSLTFTDGEAPRVQLYRADWEGNPAHLSPVSAPVSQLIYDPEPVMIRLLDTDAELVAAVLTEMLDDHPKHGPTHLVAKVDADQYDALVRLLDALPKDDPAG